ncbi:MAG: hydrolase, TatD family [Betaproteobacteria bacterium]|jgi:TatD DNase family protein|nr:hydrolase, TatD family [Betaproteobacteria bacterium]MEA3154967.1 TatD DNase family protein [Betaproteobacteria bacterium]
MMLVDSHCHLDFPELVEDIAGVLADMKQRDVSHALCVSVTLEDFPKVRALAEQHANLYASVGTHPDYPDHPVVTPEELVRLAEHPKVVAIGETGLDYYRLTGDLEWQRERFRAHIRASKTSGKPLIIHTRSAAADTLRVMREERADEAGGVMHCFTETWETAQAALELGFHISFSGIVTFKNAGALKEVARLVPLDRLLVETDSPYLAPVPYRGKVNRPGWVRYVAEEIARLRGISLEALAAATSSNFFRLFKITDPS